MCGLPWLFFYFVARVFLLLLFFRKQFQNALTLSLVLSRFKQFAIMPDVFSSNEPVHGLPTPAMA